MKKEIVRDPRREDRIWCVTAVVLAAIGISACCELLLANGRDPGAKWLGQQVKYPQAIYLVLEGLTLVFSLVMVVVAAVRGKRAVE